MEAWLARVRACAPPHRFSELNAGPDLPGPTPYELGRAFHGTFELPDPVMPLLPPNVDSEYPLTCVREPPSASARRHLAVQTVFGGSGISTRCPSPTAFALGLGPTNPGRTNLPQESLEFRRAGFQPALSLLMSAFSLQSAPWSVTPSTSLHLERFPTAVLLQPIASVYGLSPDHFRRNFARWVSCYALFK